VKEKQTNFTISLICGMGGQQIVYHIFVCMTKR